MKVNRLFFFKNFLFLLLGGLLCNWGFEIGGWLLATSWLSPHILFQCKRFMTDKYMKQVGMRTSLPRKSAQDQLPPGCGVVFWVWVQSASTFRDKVGGSTPPWSVFFFKRRWVGGWACMAKTFALAAQEHWHQVLEEPKPFKRQKNCQWQLLLFGRKTDSKNIARINIWYVNYTVGIQKICIHNELQSICFHTMNQFFGTDFVHHLKGVRTNQQTNIPAIKNLRVFWGWF